MTSNAPLTRTDARRYAGWLVKNREARPETIEIVEEWSTGAHFIRYANLCGMPRSIKSHADFIEVRG